MAKSKVSDVSDQRRLAGIVDSYLSQHPDIKAMISHYNVADQIYTKAIDSLTKTPKLTSTSSTAQYD